MTLALGQSHSVQTFDQQLYAIAKQVEFAMPSKSIFIKLKNFHTR
jgi:hypothetical protein